MSDVNKQLDRLQKRLAREKAARLAAEDILSEKSAELYAQSADTEESKKLLQMALWASGESIWSWQKNTDTFYFKEFVYESMEPVEREVPFIEFVDNIHPDDIKNFQLNWSLHQMGFSTDVDGAYRVKNGDIYDWIRFRGRVVAFNDDAAQTVVGTVKNVTDLIETETSSKLMSYAFSRSADPMIIVSKSLQIIEINEAFSKLASIAAKICQRFSLSKFIKFSHSEIQELNENDALSLETKLCIDEKFAIDIDLSITEFKSDESASDYYVVALKDLTERKKTEKKLYQLAHFDPLTNLLNRTAFRQRFEDFLSNSEQQKFAVIFVEIQGVKEVNETLGHGAGEKLLKKQSDILRSLTNSNMHLCRWGGSEFCFILPILNDEVWEYKTQVIVDKLRQQSITLDGHKVNISCSIGVSIYPEHGKTFDSLIKCADAAMFYAKSKDANTVQRYYQDISDEALKKITLLNELREAIKLEQLSFVLQGKYDTQRQLIGAEVLCRWVSPTYGPISPGIFIPLIEKNGLESDLGLLAVKNAAVYTGILNSYGVKIPISVNISSPQILDPNFLEQLITICKNHNTPYELLELEITESVFMAGDESPSVRLRAIQQAGFRISLDDFGTGYSSLSYLRQFHFDVVKIDRSFILDLEDNERAYALFVAIMDMCKALKTDTIVEGIETENQFALLNKVGVSKFQGFLLGRPIILDEFVKANIH